MNTKQPADNFSRPSVTVDVLIFTIQESLLKIALIKRGVEPFKNMWAIPGGFVHLDESLEEAAKRELAEEAGVKDVYLEQLYTFGDPKSEARWFSTADLPKLAFDHKQILDYALERLRLKIQYSNIAYGLLPKKFRLSDLQRVYEIILGQRQDKRNFRKRMLSLGLLKETGEKELEGAHRPAMLYQFKTKDIIFID